MADTRIMSGARALFSADAKPLFLCTGVDVFDGITYEATKILGQITTFSHEPTDYNVTLRASRLYVALKTLKDLAVFPKIDDTPETFLRNILGFPELTGKIQDVGVSDKPAIMLLMGVKVSSRAVGFEPGRLSFENIDLVCTLVRDGISS